MEDQDAQMLLDSHVAFSLTQHIKIPTHNRGHTLDVIITLTEDKSFQPTNMIAGPYISDHRLMILETMKLNIKPKLKDRKLDRSMKTQYIDSVKTSTMTQSHR